MISWARFAALPAAGSARSVEKNKPDYFQQARPESDRPARSMMIVAPHSEALLGYREAYPHWYGSSSTAQACTPIVACADTIVPFPNPLPQR